MRLLLFSVTLLSGLVAGLFYAYSCSVIPGLKQLTDDNYIKAMQAINIAIQNPVFFMSFMGLLPAYPALLYVQYKTIGSGTQFSLLLAAAIVYFIGVFGVTAIINVPLNDQLAAFDITAATPQQITAARRAFELSWNSWHTVRTIAAVLSFGLTIFSIFNNRQ